MFLWFFLVLVGVPCYSFHGGWLQAQSAQGQAETFQKTTVLLHVASNILGFGSPSCCCCCCNNCSTFFLFGDFSRIFEAIWAQSPKLPVSPCLGLHGQMLSLPLKRPPVGSRVPHHPRRPPQCPWHRLKTVWSGGSCQRQKLPYAKISHRRVRGPRCCLLFSFI